MLTSILLFIGVGMITITALTLLLPNFQRQKQLASLASWLNKSDVEIHSLNQNQMVRLLSQKILPGIDQKWSIKHLFGKSFYDKYHTLGRKESYIEFIAQLILKSLVMIPALFFLAIVSESALVYLLIPASIVCLFYAFLNDINSQYRNRQNQLINDLPNLISKMILALETGKSFTLVFDEVADQSKPLLAGMVKKLIANMQIMDRKAALQEFARDVDLPVIYDFVSVVNIGMDKGYKEAIPDFESIKNDLRELRKLSLIEQTKGNPAKMNLFYVILIAHILVFLFVAFIKIFGQLNNI